MALSRLLPASFEQPNPTNFIINGDMAISQRSVSAVASGNGTYNTIDRWMTFDGNDGAFTSEQSTDSPEGFSNSLKLACTTADTSLAANTYASFTQVIEAQNLQSLDYGSSNAKPITLSFWVKSNKTGTYCIAVEKNDSTLYRFVKEYTISSANTWEYKTITILPDSNIKAGAGAIANDNGAGITIGFVLKEGSNYEGATASAWNTSKYTTSNQVNNMDSTSNTWYLTGVQLEIGEKATEFEHEPYETTLAKCHRYFVKINDDFTGSNAYHAWSSIRWGSNQQFATVALPQPIRAQATVTITGTTGVTFKCDGSSDSKTAVVHLNTEKTGLVSFYGNSLSFDPANSKAGTMFINDDSSMQFDAEL